jgi:hypothetical protein
MTNGPTIQTVAEIFRAFLDEERAKLDAYELKHGPTIGNMYEGLSVELLNRAMPEGIGLRVVNGFVVDQDGNMSGQIDCMLVRGAGELIPFTDSYKWPIWDVLAVFEVKKSLDKADLWDSFFHLRGVYDLFRSWMDSDSPNGKGGSIRMANRAFQMITGTHLDKSNLATLSRERRLLHYTLVAEYLSPVRIVWAYGGYKTEEGLRTAVWDFVRDQAEKNESTAHARFGVPVFPHLISCNGISILKANGQPYSSMLRGEKWDFLLSSRTNSAWLLLELLWAKIANTSEQHHPFPDGLEAEALTPLIAAEARFLDENRGGWYFNQVKFDVSLDDEPILSVPWAPFELTLSEYILIQMTSAEEFIDTADSEIRKSFQGDIDGTAERLVKMGLFVRDGTKVRGFHDTIYTAIMPDGRYLASPNAEPLSRYVAAQMDKRKG